MHKLDARIIRNNLYDHWALINLIIEVFELGILYDIQCTNIYTTNINPECLYAEPPIPLTKNSPSNENDKSEYKNRYRGLLLSDKIEIIDEIMKNNPYKIIFILSAV